MKNEKPVVLITAASKGIGHAIAEHLAAKDWTPVLLARSGSIVEIGQQLGGLGIQGSVSISTISRVLPRLRSSATAASMPS